MAMHQVEYEDAIDYPFWVLRTAHLSATIFLIMRIFQSSLLRRMASRPLLAAALVSSLSVHAQTAPFAGRVELKTQASARLAGALDAGPLPASQKLSLVLTLAPSADRLGALEQMVSAQTAVGSASYHHWLTPAQVAAAYGATPDQLAAASAWAQAQGLTVDAVSPSGLRIAISGTVAQIQPALAVSLNQYQVAGALFFGNSTQPSLPASAATLFSGIEGLSNLPAASGAGLRASAQEGNSPAATTAADFPSLAALVDRNAAAIVTLSSSLCAADVSDTQVADYTLLFEQAAAQGMSLFAAQGCASGAFPASLAQVTAVAVTDTGAPDTATPVTVRPSWQAATGLPADALRHEPDVTASSVSALAQTIASIVQRTGTRQGNVAPVLYELAPTQGLYTQPDSSATSAPGIWEPATGLGQVDLKRLSQSFPQGATATSLQVTPSTYSLTHGGSFPFLATLTMPGGGLNPSGTVTFSSSQPGFISSSVAINGSGAATSVPYQLPGGTYPVTATYSGDGTYAPSVATTSVTVQAEAANFSISTPTTVTLGGTINTSVTLASASGIGTPTGTVTVTPNGLTSAGASSQTLSGSNGAASASFSFVANHAGSISLQATCTPGDANFTCYTQPSSSTTVTPATPTVGLTSSTNSPSAGTAATYTVTVTGISGIAPTGSIQFMEGASIIGNGTAPTAIASLTLAPGVSHSLTAVYSGDINYTKQTSNPLTPSVGTASTTTTASVLPAGVVYGSTATLAVSITPSATVNGAAPTGTLTITGAGSITSAAVTGTSTSIPLTSLPVGIYGIGVSYSGDGNYAPSSTSASVPLTVSTASATLTSQPSTTTFTTGSTSTLTEQIQLPGNTQLPANSTFTATVGATGQSYTGTFTINPGGNNGTGGATVSAPIAGTYTVTVTCNAGPNIICPASTFSITSTATSTTGPTTTGTVPTTTTLTSSASAPVAGASITLTATVAASTLTTPITGSVLFYDGTTLLGTVPLTLVGTVETAVLPVTLSGAATHSLTAVYSGDAVYKASSSAAASVITSSSPSAIALTASTTSGLSGTAVTFTARVTGSTASGTSPTGTVAFFFAGPSTLLATVPLTSGGAGVALATYTTTGFPAGTQVVYAIYNGDTNFSSVTSSSITLGFSDYGVTFNPATLTMTRGTTVQSTLTLNYISGFTGTVTFGCTPPPNTEMTCSFNPAVVSYGTILTKLRITSTAPSGQVQTGRFAGLGIGWIAGLASTGLLLMLVPGIRRRRLPALLVLLLALALTVDMGCSAGNFGGSATSTALSGTPLGTTIFTISTAGSDGTNTVKHNYSLQVTVTQ